MTISARRVVGLMVVMGAILSVPSLAVDDESIHVGVQGGVSVAKIATPSPLSSSNITGFAAGAFVEVPLTPGLWLQPEVDFVQRGASFVDAGAKVTAKYNTIEVPVFAKAKFWGDPVALSVFAGPDFLFNTSSKVEMERPGQVTSLRFATHTLNIGAAAGVGVEFGPAVLSVRYELGFSQLNKDSANWYSRGFLAMLGVRM